MKSKKAFLLGKYTVTIVIAVLCLLLLVYVLFTIYSNSQDEKALGIAQSSLDELKEKMDLAKENSPQKATLLVQEGRSGLHVWELYYFPKKIGATPEACYDDYCLCVCYYGEAGEIFSEYKTCNKIGRCIVIDGPVKVDSAYNLPADVEINFKDDKYIIKKIS